MMGITADMISDERVVKPTEEKKSFLRRASDKMMDELGKMNRKAASVHPFLPSLILLGSSSAVGLASSVLIPSSLQNPYGVTSMAGNGLVNYLGWINFSTAANSSTNFWVQFAGQIGSKLFLGF